MNSSSMKVIANTGPGRLEWMDQPMPQPCAGQVRVRTLAVGICATDLRMIAGWTRTGFPSIPGHEWVGVVDAVGPGSHDELLGRKCVADNVLSDGGEVGFEHGGGYGAYFLSETANVRLLPEGLPITPLALIEPLAVCVRGWKRLHTQAHGPMLIIGDGPIGLLMIMVARHYGIESITMLGGRQARLSLVNDLGANQCLNYHTLGSDPVAAMRRQVGQEFSAVVEASGSVLGTEIALQLAARDGRVLFIGDYDDNRAGFAWNHLLHRELTLIGSNASAGAWDEAVALATQTRLPLGRLVTHRLPARQFNQGIELTRRKDSGAIKVVLEWDGHFPPV